MYGTCGSNQVQIQSQLSQDTMRQQKEKEKETSLSIAAAPLPVNATTCSDHILYGVVVKELGDCWSRAGIATESLTWLLGLQLVVLALSVGAIHFQIGFILLAKADLYSYCALYNRLWSAKVNVPTTLVWIVSGIPRTSREASEQRTCSLEHGLIFGSDYNNSS
ncbi:hypothetical protein Q3G72_007679 [Acer saccharum]|nr:hypothetical protein Q3G72_007679 [Acer saccharum]